MTTHIRHASRGGVANIVGLLADDPLGAAREDPTDRAPYEAAFARIDADPNQHLIVAERVGAIVGTLQLSLQPGLSRRGATRCAIEGVRIAAASGSTGLGTQLHGIPRGFRAHPPLTHPRHTE